MTTTSVKIDKYTIQHEDGTNVRVFRNDLPWLDGDILVGQKMLIAVADEIETLRSSVNVAQSLPASNEIAFTIDAGEFPVHYSMSSETAAAELQKLYQEWPGGLDEIKSALRTKKEQPVPKGMCLMPIEATTEMVEAVMADSYIHGDLNASRIVLKDEYRAMVAASQSK